MAPEPVERGVEPERELVTVVAEEGEPARAAHDDVELVTVHDEIAPPLGGGVHNVLVDLDAAEAQAGIIAQALVVVARNEHEAHALARLAQQLLQHVVVRLRPMRAAAHLPEVDDVADQIDGVGFAVPKQVEQLRSLRRARAQVDVGDEERAHMPARTEAHRQVIPGFRHGAREKRIRIAGI
jgi:hypothetical protein